MLEERAGRLEKKGNPTTPIYSCARHQAPKLVEEQRLVSPVMMRHSTSKGRPRSPRRDATEQNKAELGPWTLSGAASALADCPRTARRKATRNSGAKALRMGRRDESTSCQAAGATVALAPLIARTRLVLYTNKQRGTRLEVLPLRAHYPDWRVVTSAGLALRHVWWVCGIV